MPVTGNVMETVGSVCNVTDQMLHNDR